MADLMRPALIAAQRSNTLAVGADPHDKGYMMATFRKSNDGNCAQSWTVFAGGSAPFFKGERARAASTLEAGSSQAPIGKRSTVRRFID